jgi:hypothetical protein
MIAEPAKACSGCGRCRPGAGGSADMPAYFFISPLAMLSFLIVYFFMLSFFMPSFYIVSYFMDAFDMLFLDIESFFMSPARALPPASSRPMQSRAEVILIMVNS